MGLRHRLRFEVSTGCKPELSAGHTKCYSNCRWHRTVASAKQEIRVAHHMLSAACAQKPWLMFLDSKARGQQASSRTGLIRDARV